MDELSLILLLPSRLPEKTLSLTVLAVGMSAPHSITRRSVEIVSWNVTDY
jgi:hypothetical protein